MWHVCTYATLYCASRPRLPVRVNPGQRSQHKVYSRPGMCCPTETLVGRHLAQDAIDPVKQHRVVVRWPHEGCGCSEHR